MKVKFLNYRFKIKTSKGPFFYSEQQQSRNRSNESLSSNLKHCDYYYFYLDDSFNILNSQNLFNYEIFDSNIAFLTNNDPTRELNNLLKLITLIKDKNL